MIAGMGEISAGVYFSGYSGGLTLAVAADGASKTAYGFAAAKSSVNNIQKDFEQNTNSISSISKEGNVTSITLEEALNILDNGAIDTTVSRGRTINKEKTGGIEQANKEFDKLKLKNVKEIDTEYGKGRVGELGDGRRVVVRPRSKTRGPTIEIQK